MTTTAIALFALTLAVVVLLLRTSIHNRAIKDLQERLARSKRHSNLMVDKANDHLEATQKLANMLGYCIHIEDVKPTFMDIMKGNERTERLVVHKLDEELDIMELIHTASGEKFPDMETLMKSGFIGKLGEIKRGIRPIPLKKRKVAAKKKSSK